MARAITTKNAEDMQRVAAQFAQKLSGGMVVCLSGDLGAGKTTFAQGLLAAYGAHKPYTSPTFTIVKTYNIKQKAGVVQKDTGDQKSMTRDSRSTIHVIHHVDAYRVQADDLQSLGWDDMIADTHALVILEWPERVAQIVPTTAVRIDFTHVDEGTRHVRFSAAV